MILSNLADKKIFSVKRTWGATSWGRTFTDANDWHLTLDGHSITIDVAGSAHELPIVLAQEVTIKTGIFWSEVIFTFQGKKLYSLGGIPNDDARQMVDTLLSAFATYDAPRARQQRIQDIVDCLAPLVTWKNAVVMSMQQHARERRWISEESLQDWQNKKPAGDTIQNKISHLLRDAQWAGTADASLEVIKFWNSDLRGQVDALNQKHLQKELLDCKDFFNKIERSALSPEQATAVACFDSRILVVASAGSGKTSTMVAKAAYALHRGLVAADRILMLAFNADAAMELQKRILERLAPLSFPAEKIAVKTFHAFGLEVIGKATGKKPSIASWLEHGGDVRKLSELVESLKDRDPAFRSKWDLFRIVFSRDLPAVGQEAVGHEDWDKETAQSGFRTLNGEIVKSHGERLIADWLFYNGVSYLYETNYIIDTTDATHRQYHPDFYYPTADIYHEHFALDKDGNAPVEFSGYLDGVAWKRALHRQQGTTLIETTSADLRSGKAFNTLKRKLTQRGIMLDPNPDRPVIGRKIIEHEELVKVFRVFLSHAKSNRLGASDLQHRLKSDAAGTFIFRHEMFLDLFQIIRKEWERCLKSERAIDFEDMLNLATDYLESGRWTSSFDLVMVDEFQDASSARARLTRALVAKPGRFLFAVGDDWQSINRFAGADISAMINFESWFGKSRTLRLERTFRCPQSICDVSSEFVLKNPAQIRKQVRSTQPEHPHAIRAFQVDDDNHIQSAIDKYLRSLCQAIIKGKVSVTNDRKISVFILGRYRKDQRYLPEEVEGKYGKYLAVTFLTIHGCKGLEADYVILPRVVRGRYSFPSAIEDDPVLQLAMPTNETHPFAEERRLFYVALTRARRSVALITVKDNLSEFVAELIHDQRLELLGIDGQALRAELCPECKTGSIVQKNGKFGLFQSCNNFPRCRYKSSIKTVAHTAQYADQ